MVQLCHASTTRQPARCHRSRPAGKGAPFIFKCRGHDPILAPLMRATGHGVRHLLSSGHAPPCRKAIETKAPDRRAKKRIVPSIQGTNTFILITKGTNTLQQTGLTWLTAPSRSSSTVEVRSQHRSCLKATSVCCQTRLPSSGGADLGARGACTTDPDLPGKAAAHSSGFARVHDAAN